MPDSPARRSPVQHQLDALQPEWTTISGMPVAVRIGPHDEERAGLAGLCDASCLRKFGLKGSDAGAWLAEQGMTVPAEIYATASLADGGIIARLGTEEFLLEGGITDDSQPAIEAVPIPAERNLFRVERQDATFVLCGMRANAVFAQTCGLDIEKLDVGRVVLTRVAGVNCGILPEVIAGRRCYRMWIEPSYAASLWESLAEICEELGGGPIGIQALFPNIK